MAKKVDVHRSSPLQTATEKSIPDSKLNLSNRYKLAPIGIVSVVLLAIIAQYAYQNFYYLPRRISLKSELPTVSSTFDQRVWGTYRSHLYFGMRARHPNSPLFGMIWYKQPEIDTTSIHIRQPNVRHWCEQGNGVTDYAWILADGRTFGEQVINDESLEIQTDWVNNGGSWGARVSTSSHVPASYAFVFYFMLQDSKSTLQASYENNELINITGWTPVLGNFNLFLDSSVDIKSRSFFAHKIETIPDATILKEIVLSSTMIDSSSLLLRLPSAYANDGLESLPNIIFYQFNVPSNSTMEIAFTTGDEKPLKGKLFSDHLKKRVDEYNSKFEAVYELTAKGYPKVFQDFGKVALSNMLGSIGYAYGYNRVQSSYSISVSTYGPHELFSTCPSRSVFPRGFLWDEGFHLLLLRKFDPKLTIEIMASWLDTMNIDGWIPREMILDREAEARVPADFLIQRDSIANPPMLFYFIEKFLDDEKEISQYSASIAKMYPRLRLWYQWLNKTQAGKLPGTYRWRGRNATTDQELNPKTLPSGLDDFPRATHPTDQEYHIDLRCWMALSSRVLSRLAKLAGDPVNEAIYRADSEYLSDLNLLNRLHWSEKKQRYCDYGLHSENVQLERITDPKAKQKNSYTPVDKFPKKRVLKKAEILGFVDDAFGYISLFPLLLKLLPHDSKNLEIILRNLKSEKELWTNFGLRSLSTLSPYYKAHNTEHDPPYWRGAIWINVNYMMLSSLKYYSSDSGPYRDLAFSLYSELRNNLVANVVKEFRRTGFLWESYDDETGRGRGAHPFTGWSSLVLSIMADKYD